MRRVLSCLLLALFAMNAHADEYLDSVEQWFQGRLGRLHDENGYLSLVGLYRLSEGENTLGSAEGNDCVFPEKAPAQVGVLTVKDGKASFQAAEASGATVDGQPVTTTLMASDRAEHTTRVVLGDLSFYVIERPGDQLLLRLKDRNSPLRLSFKGDIERYPVDPKWNVKAHWKPYDPPVVRKFANVLGAVDEIEMTHYLEFELDGVTYTLDPEIDTESEDLFIIFGDPTNGESTYGGGRYIHIPYADENGETWLDFNRAYNPPCVFTAYATCALASKENRLPIPVTAGEKTWQGAEGHGGHH